MAATLATASALLKEIYEDGIRKQINEEVVILRRIERSSNGVTNEVGGRYATFPIHTRRNAGIGARNEMEALPTPGQQGHNAGRIGLKYLYGGIRLSGQAMKLAETNKQSFASVLDREVSGLKDDVVKDLNRQVYGAGTGVLGTTTTAVTGNAFVVADAMYFQLGMQVDVITTGTITSPTVKASNRQVTNIDTSTNTVTLDGAAITGAIGDMFVRTGSVNREWTGLSAIVKATGTLYNIDPTLEPIWKANVDSPGAARPLSEGLMITMADQIRANGSYPTVIVGNLGVRRAYFNLLSQQRQYVNTTDFEGGFKGLSFTTDKGDIPMISDTDAPKNTLYFLNEKELTIYREADWSWMDEDGSRWSRVQGFDAYEATLYQYSELATHRRNSHGVMTNVTEG